MRANAAQGPVPFGAAPALRPSRDPDLDTKIRMLSAQAGDDREHAGRPRRILDPLNIRQLATPAGRVRIFRILLTNACRFDCLYCPMQRSRVLERHALEPERLVGAFLTAWKKGWADALFVTTAIPGDPRDTADRIVQVAESLRFRHGYTGYLHVKIVPGADAGQVRRLAVLCDRISCNLEFACGASFEELAPEKSVAGGLRVLRIANEVRDRERRERSDGRPADPLRPGNLSGATTQFLVGATPESDRRLLKAAVALHREGSVHHTHFAAFRPIRDTPLQDVPEAPFLRENRLYQSEVLLRRYGFELEELPFDPEGRLPLELDPKTAWALRSRGLFPVEVLHAPYRTLLRVPGIGHLTARRLVEGRRSVNLQSFADLRKMGAQPRAAAFLTLRGRLLGERPPEQLAFPFEAAPGIRRSYEVSPGTFR